MIAYFGRPFPFRLTLPCCPPRSKPKNHLAAWFIDYHRERRIQYRAAFEGFRDICVLTPLRFTLDKGPVHERLLIHYLDPIRKGVRSLVRAPSGRLVGATPQGNADQEMVDDSQHRRRPDAAASDDVLLCIFNAFCSKPTNMC